MDRSARSQGHNSSNQELVVAMLSSLKPETSFAEGEAFTGSQLLDSVDLICLVAELDEALGISIQGFDMVPENFASVEAICGLVEKYQKEASADG